MALVRCVYCHQRSLREDAIRQGIISFCDQECRAAYVSELRATQLKRAQRRREAFQPYRHAVLAADGDRCRFCGRARFVLHAHHVLYRSEGGADDRTNLLTVCFDHHEIIHSDKRRYQPLCLGVIWLREVYGNQDILVTDLESSWENALARAMEAPHVRAA